jgi:protein phosphatase
MVRFEDIRELLSTVVEPTAACKELTDRANQAGGHDNITVIVAKFDGDSLKGAPPEEPLRYRKYILPEEPVEGTEPGRKPSTEITAALPRGNDRVSVPQGLGSTMVLGQQAHLSPALPPPQQSPASPLALPPPDEEIEIPGTHVPPWVVVIIVVAVMAVLAATAILLLD